LRDRGHNREPEPPDRITGTIECFFSGVDFDIISTTTFVANGPDLKPSRIPYQPVLV
jgi:hypothetical protein